MSTSQGEPGLRERKKAKTRASIQDHALRLFIEQGYEATTVEQIAAAADVSQSTFFRYFPSKEETVAFDRMDPVFLDAFVAQPAGLSPIAAIRASMREVLGTMSSEASELETARQRLVFTVPELRARLFEQMGDGVAMLNEAVARRVGRDPDDFEVRMFSGAVVGIALAAYLGAADDPDRMMAELDRGLAQLERGLPL
ncbi:TetR family transcriptional regulator [Amycolatopsis sp. K13G38]|uniref:TetR family transcriptional regulator n=1 Tax=Amycolatopsis acididurans TaxID=2724524 RepID=A0ABX1J652_9PSEU|nr:TetR family transcriptional regulator [Amycolatopsis acididurans]NKQ55308.1 TetR family transcriptional regulator [Amycolatopsis acididurans]